jgi:hypothetical protein
MEEAMDDLWRDVRFAMRTLLRTPGFTVVAVATLALGIGANTAIFSVINAVLLRPLPYPEAERLVFLTEWSEQVPEMSFSVANLKDLRDQGTVFESIVGSNGQNFILSAVGGEAAAIEPERVNGRQITSGAFATLGRPPILRMALGAEREHVLRMVLRNGTVLALSGIVIGLAASFALARLVAALLFETSTADPPTFSVVPLLLFAIALLASYLPARRAARVDPMAALRYE